jgi:uncharacterized RDD family membrane protein YckC
LHQIYGNRKLGVAVFGRGLKEELVDSAILLNLTPIVFALVGALALYVGNVGAPGNEISNDKTAGLENNRAYRRHRVAIGIGWFLIVVSAAISLVLIVRGE